MSIFSKLTGIHVKVPGLRQLGGVVDKAVQNPIVDAALPLALPGVGGLIGGALKGLGAIPGVSAVEHAVESIPGVSNIEKAVKGLPLGGIGKIAGDVGGFLKDHAGDIAQYGSIADAAQRELQANKYAGKAFDLANDAYTANAPLRTAGRAGMLNPGANTPDLASLRLLAGAGSANPFAKALPMAGPAAVGNHGPMAAPPTAMPAPGAAPLPIAGVSMGRLNALAPRL